ncbi:MAG: Gamma-glutamylputrescine oxidoreductase [Candidatus Marinimicrobia bacterium]|nr:Gamma-glutamylputrescine oxidoreductase [Candidatus Neomarinimicrobiota bacterium]
MNSFPPLWLDYPYEERPALSENIQTEIAIVGGGITGISAAIHLAQKGYKPVVLEKRTIASGASGRNAGFLIAGSVEYYHRAIGFIGREKAKRLWALSLESHHTLRNWIREFDIQCDYTNDGSLVLATTPEEWSEIQEAAEKLRKDGFNAETIESEELNRWGESLTKFTGGYYCSDDGSANPARCVRGLASAAENFGVPIYENTPVLDYSESGQNHVTLTMPDATIEAQMVLVAANAFTPQLRNILDGKILPVRGQMLATEPIDAKIAVPCYANFGFDYFRQTSDGRMIIGGSRDHNPDAEMGFDEEPNEQIQSELEDYLMDLLDLDRSPEITHRWTGTMGFARDGLPVIGRLPYSKHIYVAGGFTGHGMSIATKVAEIVSTLLIEGIHPDFSMFSIRRFLT